MIARWRLTRIWSAGIMVLALVGSTATSATRQTAPHDPVVARGQGTIPRETISTALAMDQGTGITFVVSGPFSSQTGGATGRGTLTVLDTRQGALRRLRSVKVGVGPSTVVVDERAGRVLVLNTGGGDQYAGFVGGSVSVFDLRALEGRAPEATIVVHTTPLGRQLPRALDLDRTTGHAFVPTWVLPASGVITQSVAGAVRMLDTRTGLLLHTTPLSVAAEALAVDATTRHAFVLPGLPGAGARMSMLDTRTGALLRQIRLGMVGRALAVDACTGRLFIATVNPTRPTRSQVQVRTTRDSSVVTTAPVTGGVSAFAVDARRGRVFVQSAAGFANPATARGAVDMLDARDGMPLGTARVGLSTPFTQLLIGGVPQTLAVDEASGHVLVATVATAATSGARGAQAPQGVVSVLEPRGRGLRVLRARAVRGLPVALVVDAGTGRAVVATMETARPGSSTATVTARVSLLDERTGALVGTMPLENSL